MKILMLLEAEFPPDARVENEIHALTAAGHEVHLACYTRKNRPESDVFGNAIVHRKPIGNLRFKSSAGCLRFPFYFNFWIDFAMALQEKYSFDAIHIHDLQLAKVGIAMKKKYAIRLTIDLHENLPALLNLSTHLQKFPGNILFSLPQWERYEKKSLQVADHIVVVVDEAKERLIKLGIPVGKIVVVSNTINTDGLVLKDLHPEKGVLTLFYGGGINKHRGLQVVIQAIKMLAEQGVNARFWVVGDGSYKTALEQLTLDLDVQDRVAFFGYKPFREMLDYLAQSDIAIIPHVKSPHTDSTIPHKLFQYMYLGKPIISSDCAPIQRILSETSTGFIYNHDSPADLALMVKNIMANPEMTAGIAERGARAVAEKYHWGVDGKNLCDIYSVPVRGNPE